MKNSIRVLFAMIAITPFVLSIEGCVRSNMVQNVPVVQSAVASEHTTSSLQDTDAAQKWNMPQMRHALQNRPAQNYDCRACHGTNGNKGARDLSAIYANPGSHHPVGVRYPPASQAEPNLRMPDDRNDVVAFFDRNGNGQPDNDEVVLFGANGAMTVECASCHREHGTSQSPGGSTADPYLRVENANSALCMTCHRI
ncbi:MAG: hypothetical protein WBQ69_04875 [Gallionella sp.]